MPFDYDFKYLTLTTYVLVSQGYPNALHTFAETLIIFHGEGFKKR